MNRPARQLVVMGVSGSGKTTVATLIAQRCGCERAEGDDFHSPENIARMASGLPLDDARRAPWLAALRAWLAERAAAGRCAVLSCSALTRAYRDVLRAAGPQVWIAHLDGPQELVAARLAGRHGHFMARSLLTSQYAELEPLGADEPGITVDLADPPEQIADDVLRRLGPLRGS